MAFTLQTIRQAPMVKVGIHRGVSPKVRRVPRRCWSMVEGSVRVRYTHRDQGVEIKVEGSVRDQGVLEHTRRYTHRVRQVQNQEFSFGGPFWA